MTVTVSTRAAVDFTASADWTTTPTYVTTWFGSSFIGESNAISGLEQLEAQEIYRIPSGEAITFDLTPFNGALGDGDAALAAVLNAASDEVTLTFRLHNGDPGNAHTANELNSTNAPGYSRQTAQWTASTS